MTGKNLAASVAARLLNQAKQTGADYQTLLTSYGLERFLYRLSVSGLQDRFVLKGAMLLRLWSDQPYRATRDLDLLRRGEGSFAAIRSDLAAIVGTEVPPDAVVFDIERITVDAIRAEDELAGTRATIPAGIGTAKLMLQIDMGLGDAVWPPPQHCTYPTMLDMPAPQIFAYPREAVVAEKLEAVIVLGDRNSRIKDFFDLHFLAGRFEFDRRTLVEAVRLTFGRRKTPIPAGDPVGLTSAYWDNPTRPAQIRAFTRRSGLAAPPKPAEGFTDLLHAFLAPVLDDLRAETAVEGTWPPGGPWTP
jgi:hypothetical protein